MCQTYVDISDRLKVSAKEKPMLIKKYQPGVALRCVRDSVKAGDVVCVHPIDATVAEYILIKVEKVTEDNASIFLGSICGPPNDNRQGLVDGAKVKIAFDRIHHIHGRS